MNLHPNICCILVSYASPPPSIQLCPILRDCPDNSLKFFGKFSEVVSHCFLPRAEKNDWPKFTQLALYPMQE